MSKKYLISLTLSLVFSFLVWKGVLAGTQHNVSGFAWSANVGWISFNSLNCDPDGDGISNGGTGCPSTGTSIPNYGVNLDLSTGNFSGYAWAGGGEDALGNSTATIGWISFETSSLVGCPDGNCFARMNTTTGEVFGWARALANGGGWDGWIKLRGFVDSNQNGQKDPGEQDYGVYREGNEFRGWAWGGNDSSSTAVIGWISFNCKDRDLCATSSYKVYLTNPPPTAENLSVDASSSFIICGETLGSRAKFSWSFVDPGDSQSAYQIQISTTSNFSSIFLDTGQVPSQSSEFLLQRPYYPLLEWGQHYYWRLMVWDSHGASSDWILGPEFDTPSHSYPTVDFSFKPQKPTINEVVEFINNSKCYTLEGTTTCSSFSWTFVGGNPNSSNLENPTTTFITIGPHDVSLRVTDPENYQCTATTTIYATFPLPFWKEIPPFLYLDKFLASLIDVFKRSLFSLLNHF